MNEIFILRKRKKWENLLELIIFGFKVEKTNKLNQKKSKNNFFKVKKNDVSDFLDKVFTRIEKTIQNVQNDKTIYDEILF